MLSPSSLPSLGPRQCFIKEIDETVVLVLAESHLANVYDRLIESVAGS